MPKAGRILFFVLAIFAIAGANKTTFAKMQTNICSSSLVSTAICIDSQASACVKPASEVSGQIQSAIIASPQEAPSQNVLESQTIAVTETPVPNTTMPVLSSQTAADSVNLDPEKIFDLINQYRASVGLMPFEKKDSVCELAQIRSSELPSEIQHGTLHSGLYNRNLPYWIWENAKYGSDEGTTVSWWLASPIHHESIVGDYKFSCIKCTGTYCSELFTSFTPKI